MGQAEEEDQQIEEVWITILRRLSRTISRSPSSIPAHHHDSPKTSRGSFQPFPHLAGVYASSDLAASSAADLIGRGLAVQVEQIEVPPPLTQVIGDCNGTLLRGHTGPVWVVRTDYPNSEYETTQGMADKDLVLSGTRGDQRRKIP